MHNNQPGFTLSLQTVVLPTGETRDVVFRQQLRVPWLVAGVRASRGIYRNVAMELGYTTSWIKVTAESPRGGEGPPVLPTRNGLMHTFALRPVIQLGRTGMTSRAHLFTGPAVIWRTGQAFEGYSGTLRGGWSIGLGANLRTSWLTFRADVEDVIYPLKLRQEGVVTTRRRIQHNLMITIGVALLHDWIPPADGR